MSSVSLTWFLDVTSPTLPSVELEIPSRENYTSDEIAGAVDKLVQGAIRRPYGILGERQTGTAFDDTMDAAAGVFILTPSAPFYVLLLGSRRLNDDCTSAISSAADLLDAITATNRRVKPVDSLTSLGNARTALSALESASSARNNTFTSIEDVPAFQRFDQNTDRFLEESGSSIREGSTIAQTPQQARTKLGTLVSTITTAFQDIQRRTQLLHDGIDNFNSLNLPSLITQGVITKARETLQDHIDQLEPLTPTQRLEHLRDTVLDVLAGKAVVKGFGSLTRSGEFVNIQGLGVLFADADHPATSANVQSTILDPYSILTGADELTFLVDGGPTTMTLPIQHSFIAKVEGTVAESYNIGSANNKLTITLTGFSNVVVTLTTGATQSVEAVCADINAAVTTQPLVAEPYFNPEKFNGPVNTTGATPTFLAFHLITGTVTSLGINTADQILISDPLSPMDGTLFDITLVAGTLILATKISGGTPVNATGVNVSIGPGNRFLRLRVTDAGAAAALDNSLQIGVPSVTDGAATTLGIFPGTIVRSRRTRAEDVANSINSNSLASVAGVARISATSVFVDVDPTNGRSEPTDSTKIISSLYRTFGDATVGGTNAVFTVSGAQTAGVAVGNILTLRTAAIAGEVGVFGTITAVSDTSVSATMGSSITTATGLDLEFGLALSPPRDRVVRVATPSPVAGDYRTLDPLPNPTEIAIDRSLPVFSGTGGLPLQFSMEVSGFRVDFQSTSTLTDSELSVSGSAQGKFFSSPPGQAIGSSAFVLLEEDPKVLGVGDLLELYTGQYNSPQYSFPIIGFERGQQLLQVDGEIPVSFSTLNFATDVPTPFARIRKVHRNNFDAFKAQLDLWLALPINNTSYFRELNRLLNPLIVNENPTLSAVNAASTQVQSLVQGLQQLQSVLLSYQVDTVPRVDVLITSFLERGSDRAVDTLLEGRFTEFFGYNSEEVSYLGNALERLRDVSRLDLPVRRKNRQEVADQELTLGEFEEPDFEFDQSDTQDKDEPDIPGQFIEISGGNF